MPAENMEEQGLAKVPDLDLAQLKFEVAQGLGGDKKLLAIIKKDKMAPLRTARLVESGSAVAWELRSPPGLYCNRHMSGGDWVES